LPGLTYQNTTDTSFYKAEAMDGRMPVVRGVEHTPADLRTAKLIERILCDFDVDVPGDMLIAACPQLIPLTNADLVKISGRRLTVTDRGRPYVRNIAACFDPEFAGSASRHSLAV
jgi:oxygen-independent coproporphyrinogen-3 oxidase